MISIISLFLELLFNQFIPKNYFILPLFTIVSIFFLKRNRYYYIFLFTLGFIYDLFFTEIILLHSILFLFIGLLIKYFKRNILLVILIITIYQIILFFIYNLLNYNISIKEFLFIMSHYYILNIIYYYILRIIYIKKS